MCVEGHWTSYKPKIVHSQSELDPNSTHPIRLLRMFKGAFKGEKKKAMFEGIFRVILQVMLHFLYQYSTLQLLPKILIVPKIR